MNEKLRHYYFEVYAQDKLYLAMNKDATFLDLLFALGTSKDVYAVIGVTDSIIRERLFDKLAELLGVEYSFVYNMWMY